jgi:hypothetical protein
MGHFSAEGSRSGAMAAAVYLSHRVARPSINGLGKVHERLLVATKKLFASLHLTQNDARFKFVPFCPFPSEHLQTLTEDRSIFKRIVDLTGKDDDAFRTDQQLKEVGPDSNLLVFVFAPTAKHTTLQHVNSFNARIATRIGALNPGYDLSTIPITLSTTDLDSRAYGEFNISSFTSRMGIQPPSMPAKVTVLRCVVMSIYFDRNQNLENYVKTLLSIASECYVEEK